MHAETNFAASTTWSPAEPARQRFVVPPAARRRMTRLPVVPVPAGFQFQPVDAGEVADRLVELALRPPAALVPGVAGPRVYGMAALVGGYLRTVRRHRPIVPVRVPGEVACALRTGPTWPRTGLLAAGPGKRSWPRRSAAVRHGSMPPGVGRGIAVSDGLLGSAAAASRWAVARHAPSSTSVVPGW